jgi:VanZ family protein
VKRLPFFLWLIGVIGVTSFPLNVIPEVKVFGMDKLVHFFLFSVLVLFYFLGFADKKRSFLYLIVLFAIISELSQHYVPGRFVSPYDFVFNLSGLGIAWWVLS